MMLEAIVPDTNTRKVANDAADHAARATGLEVYAHTTQHSPTVRFRFGEAPIRDLVVKTHGLVNAPYPGEWLVHRVRRHTDHARNWKPAGANREPASCR